jgi:hypothetical protein
MTRVVGALFVVLIAWPTPAQAEDRFTDALLATYIVAGFTDTAQTAYCLGARICREANPAMRWAVEQSNVPTAMTAKGAIHVGVTYVLHRNKTKHPRVVRWVAGTLAVVQLAVVASNINATRQER